MTDKEYTDALAFAESYGEMNGRAKARREIRGAIAKPLRLLRDHFGPGPDIDVRAALIAIDRATRAPRKARAK